MSPQLTGEGLKSSSVVPCSPPQGLWSLFHLPLVAKACRQSVFLPPCSGPTVLPGLCHSSRFRLYFPGTFHPGGLSCSLHVSVAESPLTLQLGLSATPGFNYAIKEPRGWGKAMWYELLPGSRAGCYGWTHKASHSWAVKLQMRAGGCSRPIDKSFSQSLFLSLPWSLELENLNMHLTYPVFIQPDLPATPSLGSSEFFFFLLLIPELPPSSNLMNKNTFQRCFCYDFRGFWF